MIPKAYFIRLISTPELIETNLEINIQTKQTSLLEA